MRGRPWPWGGPRGRGPARRPFPGSVAGQRGGRQRGPGAAYGLRARPDARPRWLGAGLGVPKPAGPGARLADCFNTRGPEWGASPATAFFASPLPPEPVKGPGARCRCAGGLLCKGGRLAAAHLAKKNNKKPEPFQLGKTRKWACLLWSRGWVACGYKPESNMIQMSSDLEMMNSLPWG